MANDHQNPDQSDQQEDVAKAAVEGMLGPNPFVGFDRKDVMDSLQIVAKEIVRQPTLFANHQVKIAKEVLDAVRGQSEVEAPRKDRRFKDKQWQENRVWKGLMQSYLSWTNGLEQWISETGLEPLQEARGKFALNLLTDGLAPSNNPLTNPTALRRARETKGMSLLKGLRNLTGDMINNKGLPSQVDTKAFQVGRNLATTEGAVVFRNEVLELIQYKPTSEKVRQIPVLFVPPQINKFYVFDLSEGKSLIRYTLDQGQQVFAVSWRNPSAAQRDWGLEEYLNAIVEGMDAIKDITGNDKVNVVGACSGGITVSTLVAVLAKKEDKRINSLTQFVCVLDTAEAEETSLGLFSTPETLAAAKKLSQITGVLEGKEMARVFAWLRPNDLIWNYWVNNYLLGDQPPAFDVLFWNGDTTRLPAKLHGELLDLYLLNPFANPETWEIAGEKVDLGAIECDSYMVAGTTDHITPWRACYRSVNLMGGKTEFVLSNSGHIQSILNPPAQGRSQYMLNADHPDTPDAFLEGATQVNESWWPHWQEWLHKHGGRQINAPASLGNDQHPAMDAAPGIYVLED